MFYRKRADESISSFSYFAFTVSCRQLTSLQDNLKKKNLSTITWVKLNSKFEKEVSCRLSDILSGKATVLSSQCNNFQSIIESAGSQRDRNRLNSAFGFVSGFRDLKPVVSFWLLQCIKRKLNSSTAEASWDRISCTALKSSAWFCFVGYILYNSFLTQLVRIDSFYFNILYLLHYVGMWWLNSFPTKQLRENSVRLYLPNSRTHEATQDGLRPATWTADAMVGLASQWRYYKPEGCQVGESDERLRDNQCQLFFEQECGPSPPNLVATKLQTWGRFFLYSCDQNRKAVLRHAMIFSRA